MSKLLLLDDGYIKQMLKNQILVDEFPFLKGAAAKVAKKKPCKCGGKQRNDVADYAGIRAAIAGMPSEKKARLKGLLGAEEIRLYYTNVKRQKVKLSF